MKLYSILFEQEEKQTAKEIPAEKSPGRFIAPDYAIVDTGAGKNLILINVPNYTNREEVGGKTKFMAIEKWLVASAGVDPNKENECSGADEVSYVVASPMYPKAGYAMYCFLSKYRGKPLTSDRESSTSEPAKATWAKYIEPSGDWQKIPLDNYSSEVLSPYGEKQGYQYFDINGNWPEREMKASPFSKTTSVSDDCNLPSGSTVKTINKRLGTADAYIYTGGLDPFPLIENGNKLLSEISKLIDQPIGKLKEEIQLFSNRLFSKYYKY